MARSPQQTVGATSSNTVQSRSGNTINTALVPNFDLFEPEKETCHDYIQQVAIYVNLGDVDNNKEYYTKLLLNSIGAKHFNKGTALAAPKLATDLQYDKLLKLLTDYLRSQRNMLVVQHNKCLSKYQSEDQSAADFVAVFCTDINHYDCFQNSIAKVCLLMSLAPIQSSSAVYGRVTKVCIASRLADNPNAGHNNNKPSKQRNLTNQVEKTSYATSPPAETLRNLEVTCFFGIPLICVLCVAGCLTVAGLIRSIGKVLNVLSTTTLKNWGSFKMTLNRPPYGCCRLFLFVIKRQTCPQLISPQLAAATMFQVLLKFTFNVGVKVLLGTKHWRCINYCSASVVCYWLRRLLKMMFTDVLCREPTVYNTPTKREPLQEQQHPSTSENAKTEIDTTMNRRTSGQQRSPPPYGNCTRH
uniref:Uncharacterized protein n=1 Tax=Glossina pallidipes TaxID=7398 RepID=A0A1B0A5R4_GLOPL